MAIVRGSALRQKGHYFLGLRSGWNHTSMNGLRVDSTLTLHPLPGSGVPLTDVNGTFGGLIAPQGIVIDDQDGVIILDSGAGLLKRFDPCIGVFETLPCVGGIGDEPRKLRDPRGLALSRHGDLYIADTGNRRVQVFSIRGYVLRALWQSIRVIVDEFGMRIAPAFRPTLPPGVDCPPRLGDYPAGTWLPVDVAVRGDGCIYVADYANGLIHLFDPRGRWKTAFSGDGTPLVKIMRIAVDCDDRLYVLQEGIPYVVVLGADGAFIDTITAPHTLKSRFCPVGIAVDADGKTLCLYDQFTRQVFVYDSFCCVGSVRANGCSVLAFDRTGTQIVACDANGAQVRCLPMQTAYVTSGQFITQALDSEIYRCQWHQIKLMGNVPPGTRVTIETLTSETSKTAEEIAAYGPTRWMKMETNGVIDGEWDSLIRSLPGRYLWMRLTLTGDGKSTPSIEWVEVHYPRRSSLQYLPGVYREDQVSSDFLDHFLSIFDSMWGSISGQLYTMARLFDPRAVPAEMPDFLTWLATWLDMTLEQQLPLNRRRKLLEQAWRLYQLRGTPEGLCLHLFLCLGIEPHILEHFRLRRWLYLNAGRLGDQTLWGSAVMRRLQLDVYSEIGQFQLIDSGDPLRDPFYHDAHKFSVFLPVNILDDGTRALINRVIEASKPAHTEAIFVQVQPRLRVGIQAFIGIDTVIADYPAETITREGKLGYDTVLPSGDSRPPNFEVGKNSRIGSSTLID